MEFTHDELVTLFKVHSSQNKGPRGAYEAYYGHPPAADPEGTLAVEDFIHSFYTAYNHYRGYQIF
jgi:hypothetical protein